MDMDSRSVLAAEMRALQRVYAGLEHGLRGPVNGIVLNVELLRMQADRDGNVAARERLAGISREVDRLMQIVEPLLAVFATDDAEVSFDLNQLMKSVHDLVAPHARQRRVRIAIDGPSDERLQVSGDAHGARSALLVMLSGLIENASGAAILIRTVRVADQGEITLERLDESGVSAAELVDDEAWQAARHLVTSLNGRLTAERGRNIVLRLPLAVSR